MNELRGEKSEPKDLVSENIDYKMEINPEILDDFPRVTDEDLVTHVEKFVALFGKWEVKGEEVSIKVEGILISSDPKVVFQNPKGNEVVIDFRSFQNDLNEAKLKDSGLSDMDIIGEVHTHPYKNKQEITHSPYSPSSGDIDTIIEMYKSGVLPNDKPFVFGISSMGENGKNTLAFYRIVRDANGKLIPFAFNDWEWGK